MPLDFLSQVTLLDGAMGTLLQQKGLPPGEQPALLSLTQPRLLEEIHRAYLAAGSRILYANTFGANPLKLSGTGHTTGEVIAAALAAARRASDGSGALVALDVGPLGQLLEPMGSLTFEDAYRHFREVVEAGRQGGAQLIVLETFTDLYEAKAALLAAKEHTSLPVFVTMSFEASGRTFTGCTAASMARTLESLGADAIGLNCSLGPDKLLPVVQALAQNTRLPIIVKPNAGLPDPVDGRYHLSPQAFAQAMLPCLEAGATLLGGCCGTTPAHMEALARAVRGRGPGRRDFHPCSFLCTPTRPLPLEGVRVIGERLNPTGKKRLRQALLEEDLDYVLRVAVAQEEAGAHILDVNVGCPGVDEVSLLPKVVKKLQSAVSLPLQLDSSDPAALEAALRVVNGKAAVNSVNGDPLVLRRLLPVVKKYGAAVVGLCLDQDGIPSSASQRLSIARRILDAALACGIPREDVWIDPLTLTVSAQQDQAPVTLRALELIRRELGLQTVLGVSNISFGLPNRPLMTRTFLTAALERGLTLPILDPGQTEAMDAVSAFRVLSGEDGESREYLSRFASQDAAPLPPSDASLTLEGAVYRGLGAQAGLLARQALEEQDPLSLIECRLIPALDRVGEAYDAGKLFLPQLLSAAQAAQAVSEEVKAAMARRGEAPPKKGLIVVATVRGDIHDIGKNIVKTVLENYGYRLLDLGRDVPAREVVRAVTQRQAGLVGLSALMTTTLPAMAETVRLLKDLPHPPTVFVGGAVVTQGYASSIGADYYAKDARASVEIAREVLG